MFEVLASTSLYTAVAVLVLSVFSLVGLILFATREPKFEDVVAAQKKEQEDLLSSLLNSKKPGKSKKWAKLKQKKKTGERKDDAEDVDVEVDSGVDDEEPSSESISSKHIPSALGHDQTKKSKASSESKSVKPVVAIAESDNPATRKHKSIVDPSSSKHVTTVIEPDNATIRGPKADSESASSKSVTAVPGSDNALTQKPKKSKNVKASREGLFLKSGQTNESKDAKMREGTAAPNSVEPEEASAAIKEDAIQPLAEERFESSPSHPEIETVVVTEEVRLEAAPDSSLAFDQELLDNGSSMSAPKKPKSKSRQLPKPEVGRNEGSASVAEKMKKDVEAAALDASQVQEIIDILLLKQNELEQWQKPGQKVDPVEQLKRQIQDYEASLIEEKKITASALQKSNKLRTELIQERAQLQSIQQQANAKIAQQTKEIEAIHKRMEASQDKHMSDMQSAQAQIARMQELIDEASSHELHKLKEVVREILGPRQEVIECMLPRNRM